jgi:glycosyltransferase involved in cell wall biosynthesis
MLEIGYCFRRKNQMISIIIPAYNEGSVIARTLDALTIDALPDELDVVVVCNGCTDDTAVIARNFGAPVRVIETSLGNKANALNLGDQVARTFPRIYVDADVIVTLSAIRAMAECLKKGDVIAVAPMPHFEVASCPWPVRAFYDIRCRLPSFSEGIGGSGVYALSEIGRCRFGAFPNLIADDTYVRVQFKAAERKTLNSARSIVFAPRTIQNLIAIETRADFGTFELARRHPELWTNKGSSNYKALLSLLKDPSLWPRIFIYLYVRMAARRRAKARFHTNTFVWERDGTSRNIPEAQALPNQIDLTH